MLPGQQSLDKILERTRSVCLSINGADSAPLLSKLLASWFKRAGIFTYGAFHWKYVTLVIITAL
jgi:hypothetical protein